MNANCLEIPYQTPPLNLGVLKIHQQCQVEVGCAEVVEALGYVLVTEFLYALELDDDTTLDHNICEIVSDTLSFVSDVDGDLSLNAEPATPQFQSKCAFVNLLEKTSSKYPSYFVDGSHRLFDDFGEMCSTRIIHRPGQ